MVLDLRSKGISGKSAEKSLESVGIILNRNVVPQDAQTPGKISGIRIGSGAVSARGMGASQIRQIVDLMDGVMMKQEDKAVLKRAEQRVLELCGTFPVNGDA